MSLAYCTTALAHDCCRVRDRLSRVVMVRGDCVNYVRKLMGVDHQLSLESGAVVSSHAQCTHLAMKCSYPSKKCSLGVQEDCAACSRILLGGGPDIGIYSWSEPYINGTENSGCAEISSVREIIDCVIEVCRACVIAG